MRVLALGLLSLSMGLLSTPAAAWLEQIVDYVDQPVMTGSGKPPTSDEVKQAILNAATKQRWDVKYAPQGQPMLVTNYRGPHVVELEIIWNAEQYSVKYKDSAVMSYQVKDGKGWIHPAYSRTVRPLVNGIRNELRLL
jgi:uncharacterized protein YcgI (DUF1989 family)